MFEKVKNVVKKSHVISYVQNQLCFHNIQLPSVKEIESDYKSTVI